MMAFSRCHVENPIVEIGAFKHRERQQLFTEVCFYYSTSLSNISCSFNIVDMLRVCWTHPLQFFHTSITNAPVKASFAFVVSKLLIVFCGKKYQKIWMIMMGEYFERGLPGDQLGDHALACDGPPDFEALLVVQDFAVQLALC